MGCDIHLHQEVKINGKWHHYATVSVPRNYRLFSLMADVRNQDGILPISKPKGIPKDATALTKYNCNVWGADGHSHSYLTKKEILLLRCLYPEICFPHEKEEVKSPFWFEHIFGFLFGNFWDDKGDDESIESVRWIFWFDN